MNPVKRLGQRTSRAQAPGSQLHPRFRHGCSLFPVHPGLRPEIFDSISGIPAGTSPLGHLPDNSERPQLTVPGIQLPLSASRASSSSRCCLQQAPEAVIPVSAAARAPLGHHHLFSLRMKPASASAPTELGLVLFLLLLDYPLGLIWPQPQLPFASAPSFPRPFRTASIPSSAQHSAAPLGLKRPSPRPPTLELPISMQAPWAGPIPDSTPTNQLTCLFLQDPQPGPILIFVQAVKPPSASAFPLSLVRPQAPALSSPRPRTASGPSKAAPPRP